MSDKRNLVEKFGSQSGRVAACESKGEAPSKPCDLPADNAGMIEPPFRRLAKGYERFFRPGLDNIIFNVYGYLGSDEVRTWWWESKAPDRCFVPEPPKPKEPKPRELATGYKRVQESGRTIIFRDSEAPLGAARGTRLCWIEGQDDVPDHVYAPDAQAPGHRKGDWVRYEHGPFYPVFDVSGEGHEIRVTYPSGEVSPWVDGEKYHRVHRCPSAPTGPIRAGSVVKFIEAHDDHCGRYGIVGNVDSDPLWPLNISLGNGYGTHRHPKQVEHIAAPPEVPNE